MSVSHAFTIEGHGRPGGIGIVVAERGGFMFFAAERAFQAPERRMFKPVAPAERAARQARAEHDKHHRH